MTDTIPADVDFDDDIDTNTDLGPEADILKLGFDVDDIEANAAPVETEPDGCDCDEPVEDPDIVFTDDDGTPVDRRAMLSEGGA